MDSEHRRETTSSLEEFLNRKRERLRKCSNKEKAFGVVGIKVKNKNKGGRLIQSENKK